MPIPHIGWIVEVVGEHTAVPVGISSRDVLKPVGQIIPSDTFKVYTAWSTVKRIRNVIHSTNTTLSCQ